MTTLTQRFDKVFYRPKTDIFLPFYGMFLGLGISALKNVSYFTQDTYTEMVIIMGISVCVLYYLDKFYYSLKKIIRFKDD